MRAEGIIERSVLFLPPKLRLSVLLNKFKNTKRSISYRLCRNGILAF